MELLGKTSWLRGVEWAWGAQSLMGKSRWHLHRSPPDVKETGLRDPAQAPWRQTDRQNKFFGARVPGDMKSTEGGLPDPVGEAL